MRVYAFEGLVYGPSHGDAGSLAAPPYDQINDKKAEAFHALDRHHFTWLTKPLPGASGDPYQEAARLHGAWLEEEIIRRDDRPALYPYVIDLADGGRRLGVMALVGLEPRETGVIRPHEETLAKPLADRLALLEAMEVDLEPALLLSEDGGRLDALLAQDLENQTPFVRHTDADGHHHLLYRITDPERLALYREVFASSPAAIADGHHRYKVALRYAESRGLVGKDGDGEGDQVPAAAAKMAVITSLDSPALAIQPIHRALGEAIDLTPAAELTVSRSPVEVDGGQAFADAVAEAPQPALGVWVKGQRPEIWQLDPEAETPGDRNSDELSPAARRLPVALLHGTLLPALGFSREADTDGTVLYRSEPAALWQQVDGGDVAIGIWLPPMEPAAFAAAIADGDLLPPKSTRFLPKVVSGLVWADHGSKLA